MDGADVNIIEYQEPAARDVWIEVIVFQLRKGKRVRAIDKNRLKGLIERMPRESPLGRSLNERGGFLSE